jgi:hypothetical protein
MSKRLLRSGRALRIAALLALAGSAWPVAAQTASYARGETLWTDHACFGCHMLTLLRSRFATVNQTTGRARLDAAISGTTVGGVTTGMQGFASLNAVDRDSLVIFLGNFIPSISVAPGLTVALTSSGVGTPSAPATITLTNTGRVAATFGADIVKGGSHPSDFSVAGVGNGCAAQTIAVNAGCQLSVIFTPAASGARSADVTLSHNGDPGTTVIQLTGSTGGGSTSPPTGSTGGGGSIAPWLLWLLLPAALGLRASREQGLPPAGPV